MGIHTGPALRWPRLRASRATCGARAASLLTAALLVGGVPDGGVSAARAERMALGSLVPREAEAALADPALALRRAREAEDAGDVDGADALYADVARRHPVIADHAALLRVRMLRDAGRVQAGVAAAESAIAADPRSPLRDQLYGLLGDLYAALGEEEAARAAWERALDAARSNDQRAAIRASLAASYERSGQLERAADQWLAIWRHHPASDPAPKAEKRLDALERFFGRKLRTPSDWRRRGDRLFALLHNQGALAAYDTALAGGLSRSEARRALRQRAFTLFRLRRYTEAAAAFGRLPREAELEIWRARSVARTGDVDGAVTQLETLAARTRGASSVSARFLAALLLDDEGEHDRARRHFEIVAQAGGSGQGASALWRLGWDDYRAGRWGDAVDWFGKLERAEGDPVSALRARYWRARALAHGSAAAARREFDAIAREYPLSYYGWRAAQQLAEVGDPDEPVAEGEGEQAIAAAESGELAAGTSRLRPEQVERPRILLRAGMVDAALDELDRVNGSARGLRDRLDLASLYSDAGDAHRAQRLMVDAYGETLARGPLPGYEQVWWYAYPHAYAEMVSAATRDGRSVEPDLVWSIMREESGFRPAVLSVSGARGLLQIMTETGARLARDTGRTGFSPDDLFDPAVNIELGAAYLARLSRRFDGRLEAAIASYNAGPAVVSEWVRRSPAMPDDEWVETIPYEQTRLYVKRVLRTLRAYRVLY